MLLSLYLKWQSNRIQLEKIRIGFSLTGVWRKVAFLDVKAWAHFVDIYDMPILNRDRIFHPTPINGGQLVDLNPKSKLWASICTGLTKCFGLPLEVFEEWFMSTKVKKSD